MKKVVRIIAVFLSLLIVVQSVPLSTAMIESVTAEQEEFNPSPTSENYDGTEKVDSDNKAVYIICEEKSKREEYVKHFRMSDGTYKAVIYSSPVHEMKNGEWTEIDNSINLNTDIRNEQGKYIAKILDTEFSFSDKINTDNAVKIRKNGNEISFSYINNGISLFSSSEIINTDKEKNTRLHMTDSDKTAVKSGVLKYSNASKETDIEYELNSTMLKESIIISNRQNEYVYKFSFDVGSLTPVANEDGSISLIDEVNNNSLEYVITAPFMIDNKGLFSDRVSMALSSAGEKHVLTVTADKEWLNDEDREFPVLLDPTILYRPDRINDIFDTYTDSGSPSTNHYLSTYSIVGHNSMGTGRSYIKFNLPELPHCGVITYAQLYVIQLGYDPGNGVTNHIAVYECPSEQNYQTLTWNNQPSLINQPIIDYNVFKAGEYGSVHYSLDITKIAKKWFEEGINNGLFLASANESSSWRSTIYTSNYAGYDVYPMISISYIDNVGIEDYWSYEALDLGRSGTVYINEYNGLLTYVHQDINLGGNITYLNAAHIYSNNHKNAAPYGYGFRLSAQESITTISSGDLYDEGYSAYLTDADGTAHYFKYVDDYTMKYEFDDNLILKTVSEQTYEYELQYEDGSKKQYDAEGRLLEIFDRNGNSIRQTYDSEGRVYKIFDELGRKVTFNYSGGFLESITDDAGRVTTYTYDSGYLKKITYPDGKTTQLGYISGKLFSIRQVDTTTSMFMYQSSQRVNYITLKGTDNTTTLNNISFYYKGSNTVIADSKGRELTVGFDNMGRAVSYMDKEGNISTTKYNNNGNVSNKIAESSDTFSFSDNLLVNHSFENEDSNWYIWQPTGTSNYSFNNPHTYVGEKSLNVSLSSAGRIVAFQDYSNISQGEEYTFSAYVKASSISNANAFLRIEGKNSGTASTSESIKLTKAENEWVRLQTTYTVPSNVTYLRLCLEINGDAGVTYFDALQLERSSSAGHYNLLTNPSFENYTSNSFTGWTSIGTVSAASGVVNNSVAASITGSPTSNARLLQNISLDTSSESRTLVFGGKVKANCAAGSNSEKSSAKFSILVETYAGSTYKSGITATYNPYAIDTVQAISAGITIDPTVTRIVYCLYYDKNVNISYFDDVFLYIDNFGTKYEYDDNGKLIKQSNNDGDAISYRYSGPDITKISVTKNGEEKDSCEYTYDSNHNILTETTKDGIITEYTYPSRNRGMPKTVTVRNSNGSLQSSLTYTYMLFDNYTRSITDARGKTESYFYNSDKDLLTQYTDANGVKTNYEYNELNDELIRVYTTVGSTTVDVNYSVDTNGRLSSITQDGVSYGFTYDVFGRRTATKVGSQTLASYAYNYRGLLDTTIYGNGATHSLIYDSSDRVTSEIYNGTTAYSYAYNTEGYLGKTIDHELGITTYYGYDLAGRVTDVDSTDNVSSDYSYNEQNSIESYSVKKNNTLISGADYTYKSNGLLQEINLEGFVEPEFEYVYDGLNRITRSNHYLSSSPLQVRYSYLAGNNSSTTGLISSIQYLDMGSDYMPELSYTYDNKGNILTVSKSGTTQITYTYDSLNRLIREDNKDLNQSVTYEYDVRGNILNKKIYAYTTGTLGTATDTITYSYDSVWKDKLTSYDGESISYDSIGNPTSYRGATLTWQKGRQLASINTGTAVLNFKYNIDGLRTEKKVGSKTYSYIWSSGLLMQQSDGTNTLKFSYSPDGRPLGVLFNGASYYYIYNLQGDVIGLYNYVGSVDVRYTYDSWGKLISTTGSLASTLGKLNPFRYRGYIYDEETGLYWLRSRYYDPAVGRFLNADVFVSTGQGINALNMFAYCANNPVNYTDITGTMHVKGTDACGGYGNYSSFTVGFVTYYSQTKDEWSIGNLYGGVDTGESYTISSNSNQNYDLVFFNQISHEEGTVFDNMFGMNMNIKNGGFRIATGPASYSITVCFDNTNYEYFSSPTKTSFTVASGVDYKNLTAEGYMSYYIRPAPILGTFAIAYLVPEVVYFVASYFGANGISSAHA